MEHDETGAMEKIKIGPTFTGQAGTTTFSILGVTGLHHQPPNPTGQPSLVMGACTAAEGR